MQRKRASHRPRARRDRRAAPATVPVGGMRLTDLASAVGVPERTLRYWLSKGLIPAPAARGAATRYDRRHLLCACAIAQLQRDEHLSLAEIRARLAGLSPADFERFAPDAESAAAPAPPAQPAPTSAPTSAPEPASPGLPAPEPRRYAARAWERIELLPGLELSVERDASPLVRRAVQTIVDWCGSQGLG